MIANTLLNRLELVKGTGPGRWLARCPAHDDRSPSLSIRAIDDGRGRILIHCFAGCGGAEVMAAIGLTLSDLYSESLPSKHEGYPPSRQRIHPSDALKVLAHEATLAAIMAADVASGKQISDADAQRCAVAAGRISAATGGVA